MVGRGEGVVFGVEGFVWLVAVGVAAVVAEVGLVDGAGLVVADMVVVSTGAAECEALIGLEDTAVDVAAVVAVFVVGADDGV